MDEKKLMLAREELKAKLQSIAITRDSNSQMELAKIANIPYDAELPVPEIIEKVCNVERVGKGEDYEYFSIGPDTKTVYTISNGSVTQANVTPDTPNDLTFNSYNGPAEYVYVEKLLEAKYDVIAKSNKKLHEGLDRKEVKDVLDVLIASAEGQSQTFSLDSGDSYIKLSKLDEMVTAIEKYGTKVVVIAGSTCAADIRKLNYNEDKNQAIDLKAFGIDEVIKVPAFTYTHSTSQTVLAADKMIVVALSDSEGGRPVDFVRRKVADVFNGGDDKERIIVATGPRLQVGSNPKWAYELAVMEQYGVVQPNPYAVAVFKRASSYS